MAAEGWYEGTWNDWRWRTPHHRSSLEFIEPSSWMDDIRLGYNRIRPLTSLAMIHASPVMNGAKLFHRGTKSRPGVRLACWTPAKAKPKDRLMSGAGDSRRDPMSLRQQLRRRMLRSTSHRERIGSRQYSELVICKG